MTEANCMRCQKEYIYADLYCTISGRGANSLCDSHGNAGLLCNDCLQKLGMVDNTGEFVVNVDKSHLRRIIEKSWKQASPYTGEYWMGRADLAAELLGHGDIDWDAHPRSIKTMFETGGAPLMDIGDVQYK